ncbi:MAG: transposase [Myxococcota bacterium]
MYASPVIDGNDRETLERVCRSLLRGPIALLRLRMRPDGMVEYRMKKADRRGDTVMVMHPVDLLMRLCSLIPAPGRPTRKYFGVLAPRAKLRAEVVPRVTARAKASLHEGEHDLAAKYTLPRAELRKRVWDIDALVCPRCEARMRAIAVIEDAEAIRRYLGHTGETTVYEQARGPPDLAA